MYKYANMIYKGMELQKYCISNNYDYEKVYHRLKYLVKAKKYCNMSIEQKIELAIARYNNRDNYKYSSYIYKGQRLRDYCKERDIDMQFMYSKLIALEKSNVKKYLPLDIKIEIAINCYNGINDYIYANIKYKGEKLSVYCRNNGIKYSDIHNRIKYDLRKGNIKDFPSEERIDNYIESYFKFKKIKEIKKCIQDLTKGNLTNKEYKNISKILNINYEKLQKIKYSNIKMNQLILLSWYSSDISDDNGSFITKAKLKHIFKSNDLNINDLYVKYKCGDKKVLLSILEYEKFYLMGILKREVAKYNIELSKQNYKELMDYVRFNLIKCVDNSVSRYPGEIVNYIDITISKKVLQYLIENIFNKSYEYNDNMKEKKNDLYWDY